MLEELKKIEEESKKLWHQIRPAWWIIITGMLIVLLGIFILPEQTNRVLVVGSVVTLIGLGLFLKVMYKLNKETQHDQKD